ncbi:MAG: GGDEF domain-containing protein [Pseudomonadota bacterium]
MALIALGAAAAYGLVHRPLKRRIDADISSLERSREEMTHSALHDALTGLPNRRYLDEFLGKTLASASRNKQTVGLLHIDLDKFKEVNDTLGHEAGDTVLKAVTKTLLATIRNADFAARVGGDEFVIIAPSVNSIEGLGILSERLVRRLSTPIPYDDELCQVGASIGIALARPDTRLSASELIRRADEALYSVKRAGRAAYRFHPGDDEPLVETELPMPPGRASAA